MLPPNFARSSRSDRCRPVPRGGMGARLMVAIGVMFAIPQLLYAADVAWRESFSAPEPSWNLQGPADARLVDQRRQQAFENGMPLAYETIGTSAPAGYSAYVEQAIPSAPLIEELKIEAQVRSPQPGLQIGVEVVCPRTAAGGQNGPARLLVVGSRYARPGTWQTLVVENLPLAAKRQARFQKTPAGEAYDLQEAYIDRVVLIVPGGGGTTVVDIDEVIVYGVVFAQPPVLQQASHTVDPSEAPILEGPLLESVLSRPPTEEIRQVEISRRGATLAIADAPFLPRVVQYRGESLTTLGEMGFNTIWLDHIPSPEELAKAHQARLWVIAPPPPPEVLAELPPQSPWQSVLAWSLGKGRTAIDVDATRSLADATRLADRHLARPLVVGTFDRRRTYGQLADILVDPHTPWTSGYSPPDATSTRLLGSVRWVAIETQQSPLAKVQSLAFAPHQPELAYHPPLKVRQTAIDAVAGGARGIVIQTGESLANKQGAARLLATQLELLHRELLILEPWLVGGKLVGGVSVDRRSEVVPYSWQLQRARLVLIPPHAPLPPPASPIGTLTAAGIPETASAHLVTTSGLIPLEAHRVAGGLRVVVGDMTGGALILLTDDQRAITQLRQHTTPHAERSAKGERDLAMEELMALDAALQQATSRDAQREADPLAHGKAILEQCDLLLASRDYPRAVQLARTLRYAIDRHSRQSLTSVISNTYHHESWPLRSGPVAWGSARALRQAVESLPRGPNILPDGDFEHLDQLRSTGWTHLNYDSQAWTTGVELVADSPRHGASALRLKAAGVANQVSDVAAWQPLVWINSPELTLPRGATVEISGWARVGHSTGRLLVSDSLGGEELSLSISETKGWESFRLIRSVGPTGKLGLRLALIGPGEVDVDAVMIRQVMPPTRSAPASARAPVPGPH